MSRGAPRSAGAGGSSPAAAKYGQTKLSAINNANVRVIAQGANARVTRQPRREHVCWVLMYAGKPKHMTTDPDVKEAWKNQVELWLGDRYQLLELTFLA